MSDIFDVSADDIKKLGDNDLRELIGRLCEMDYRLAKIGTKGITWGGNQDAADGGLDVAVRDDAQPPINSNIPRKHTGFQVKKPAMGASQILKEMKPNGLIRDSIKKLILEGGAYIIVSSGTSATDSLIARRKDAMRNAVSDIENHENLLLDFYDCGRVATWVRSHPTLIPWVRMKIGRHLHGWQPYGNWSFSPKGLTDFYLISEGLRIYRETTNEGNGVTILDSIHFLRGQLSHSRECFRLVGLSGVGKTRFVQALFDERIGDNYLPTEGVIYADMSDGPSPDPVSLAKSLISEQTEAILIIDNCPPDLHKRLAPICCGHESTINLITIEYDVRDDLPEETSVLRLEPADDKMIIQLIESRFDYVNQADARNIAEVAGGNARVAIAIASTIKQGETLGRLRDGELFKRLFNQTNDHDDGLLQCAEALSLLYSFEGTDIDSPKSELKLLASIIERPVGELYRNLSELKRRQLVQSRNVWRAILPHAIANSLAEQALKTIPTSRIVNTFMAEGRERLLRSFSRRLSFLHDNIEAKKIVTEWLAPRGWLGLANGNLDRFGFDILENIAPVAPQEALAMIEHYANGINGANFIAQTNNKYTDYSRLLKKIAYDPTLFLRCVTVICQFALAEDPNSRNISARDTLKSLFFMYLSGTHANSEMKAGVIKNLWNSVNEAEQELAIFLLEAAYEASHFMSHYESSFGARPRDWGWKPKTREDVVNWYSTFMTLGLDFIRSNSTKSQSVKKILADKFYGLWREAHLYDELEILCDKLIEIDTWNDGWLAVRRIISFNSTDGISDAMNQLRRIETKLRPSGLLERARVYALTEGHLLYDAEDIGEVADNRNTRIQEITFDLGRQIAIAPELFAQLLPDLVSGNNITLWSFGEGLAETAPNKMKLWDDIKTAYTAVHPQTVGTRCLMGVLSSPHMDLVREEIMDSLVDDSILGKHYPEIQISVPITPRALTRLHRALDLGIAPIQTFQYIGWGRSHEVLTDADLVPYLNKIYSKDGGIFVALSIIKTRLDSSVLETSDAMLALARDILMNISYDRNRNEQNHSDFSFAEVANKCMRGPQANDAANRLCEKLAKAIGDNILTSHNYPYLISKMAELHPIAFLNAFLSSATMGTYRKKNLFRYTRYGENPLDKISDSIIIEWCEEEPVTRYPIIAYAMVPFKATSKESKLTCNSLVYKLLEYAPDITEIFKEIEKDLEPSVWSGSWADIVTQRATVLQELFSHDNKQIAQWAKTTYDLALSKARRSRISEQHRDLIRNETFE